MLAPKLKDCNAESMHLFQTRRRTEKDADSDAAVRLLETNNTGAA
jgi:hypothetical protein